MASSKSEADAEAGDTDGQPSAMPSRGKNDGSATARSAADKTKNPNGAEHDSDPLRAALALDVWYRQPGSEKRPAWRRHEPVWRHPQLAEWLADDQVEPDTWRRYLHDSDPVVRTNAAIALARIGALRDIGPLASAIRQRELRLEQRLAAAESLARLPADRRLAEIERLLDEFGKPEKHRRRYVAELHAALLRGLAHDGLALNDSRLLKAMNSEWPAVRAAALETWAAAAAAENRSRPLAVPEQVLSAREDRDPRVRRAALEALAASATAQAREGIEAALDDHDLGVRRTAIVALGRLAASGDAAKTLEKLNTILREGAELDRIAAVEGLAQARQWEALLRATDDQAWRVRRAVAIALGQIEFGTRPPAVIGEMLTQLVGDASSQVQAAAVETLAGWPIEAAGPILIEALERSGYHARQRAAKLLATKWPPARKVRLDAQGRIAAEQIAQLRKAWQAESAHRPNRRGPERGRMEVADAGRLDRATLDALQAAVEQIAQGEVVDADATLRQIAPDTVEALEQLIEQRNVRLPAVVLRELTTADPAFELVARLSQETARQRRHTVRELARLAAERPLRPLARHWLALMLSDEDDALVWQQAWPLLAEDTSDVVEALAYRCLVHRSPQVRRLACRYFGRHGQREAVASLLKVLNDEQPSVVMEAIDALGQEDMLDDPAPLIGLLDHSSPEVRLKAAQALVRRGVAEGVHALERAAYDPDARVRTAAARTIGELGRAELGGILVGMLDDSRLSVRRAAMNALRDLAGHDVGRPDEDRAPRLADEVRRWKQWWADQQAAPASRQAQRNRTDRAAAQ